MGGEDSHQKRLAVWRPVMLDNSVGCDVNKQEFPKSGELSIYCSTFLLCLTQVWMDGAVDQHFIHFISLLMLLSPFGSQHQEHKHPVWLHHPVSQSSGRIITQAVHKVRGL